MTATTGMAAGAAALAPHAKPRHATTTSTSAATTSTGTTGCTSTGCPAFQASGLDGGSYVVAIVADPFHPGVLLAGSDVGGVYRSTDWGAHWTAQNQGLVVGSLSVASFAFSPVTAGRVYVALGNNGPGGVEESTDDGLTWTLRSSVPQFNGPNPYTGVRASGRRLAAAPDGTLYAATSGAGVMRSTDDGANWTTIGLGSPTGAAPRGLILDPSNPDTLYVANDGAGDANYPAGLYVSTDATASTPAFAPVPGAAVDVEDLSFVGPTLYLAASAGGVQSLGGPSGPVTQLIAANTGLWATVDGDPVSGGPAVLYAGAARPEAGSTGGYQSVVKSTDGGATWSSVTSGSGVAIHPNEGGSGGPVWWMTVSQPGLMLGAYSYIPRELVVDPADPSRVVVAGNADIWSSSDAGADWYPMVRGLSTTEERGVVADPKQAGTVYSIGYDWGIIGSTNGMTTVADVSPTGVSAALDVALDTATSPSTVYLAGFDETAPATTTDVYSNPDPLGGGKWTSLGLKAVTGGQPVLGVAANKVAGSGTVVLAAVGSEPGIGCTSACGIWRKAGGGPWQKVQAVAMSKAEGGFHASFGWLPGSSTAYLYDPATGLWRSTNSGGAWTQIWTAAFNHDLTGYIGVAAGSGTVYVSLGTWGVWKLTGASTNTVGTGIASAQVGSFGGAGPLTVAPDGSVWVAQDPPYGSGLWRSLDGGSSWSQVGDATYASMGDFPTGLAVTSGESVYVSTRGDGVITTS